MAKPYDNPKRKYETPLDECVDRLRRMETRFTSYLEQQGFDTQTKPCTFSNYTVTLPNINASVKDMLAAIPKDCVGIDIRVMVAGQLLCVVST